MSWWRRLLRREPPEPRGRHRVGARTTSTITPAELTERMTGMIDTYVPTAGADPEPDPVRTEPPTEPLPVVTVPHADLVTSAGTGSVVLGFADGSHEVLTGDDARSRPFQALVRELLRGAA